VSSWWCCQSVNLSILGGFYVVTVHYTMLSWQNWKLWLEHVMCYGIEILFDGIIIENNDSSWEWTWNNLILNCALEIKIIRHLRKANNLVDEQIKSLIYIPFSLLIDMMRMCYILLPIHLAFHLDSLKSNFPWHFGFLLNFWWQKNFNFQCLPHLKFKTYETNSIKS
jgi:hypothetical protein